ncbi:MAG: hypothetical protein ACXV5U_10870, partial [Ilumatobacteraceae bacterium]
SQPCTIAGGRASIHGTIHNLDDRDHDYRIVVEFSTSSETKSSTAAVRNVAADATAPWSTSIDIAGNTVTCKVTDVFGPMPFEQAS